MKKLTCILIAIVVAFGCQTKVMAESYTDISTEIISRNHEDWRVKNYSTSAPGFNEVFESTVFFTPTKVSAMANVNTITVNAEMSTAVRHVFIDYSQDKRFWDFKTAQYRNVKYTKPVIVKKHDIQLFRPNTKTYSSSSEIGFYQGNKKLWGDKVYHPKDQWGMMEITQRRVDKTKDIMRKNKTMFMKSFKIFNVPDCKDGYYVRITYIYTNLRGNISHSDSVIVKVK